MDHHDVRIVEALDMSFRERGQVRLDCVVDHVVHGLLDRSGVGDADDAAVVLDADVDGATFGVGERDNLLRQAGSELALELDGERLDEGHGPAAASQSFLISAYFDLSQLIFPLFEYIRGNAW